MKQYLEQLIFSLQDSDIERLQKMNLKKSKIRTYLETLVENRATGIPVKESVMEMLDVDENSFKKMRSVLFSRCLHELVPQGGTSLLHFLSRYRLNEIFWRKADDIIGEMKKNKS